MLAGGARAFSWQCGTPGRGGVSGTAPRHLPLSAENRLADADMAEAAVLIGAWDLRRASSESYCRIYD